jgi:glutaredoxin
VSTTTVIATVYSRTGCHICDQALEALEAMKAERPELELEVVDIEQDDELLKRYLERIPVVTIGGDEISELVLDADAVLARLDNP